MVANHHIVEARDSYWDCPNQKKCQSLREVVVSRVAVDCEVGAKKAGAIVKLLTRKGRKYHARHRWAVP